MHGKAEPAGDDQVDVARPRTSSGAASADGAAEASASVGISPVSVAPYDRRKTSRRQAEQALALYRAIVANSTEAIAIVDLEGSYLEQNTAHERLLGYAFAELHGQTPAIHMGADAFAEIAAELATSGRCRRELRSVTKEGRPLDIELSAFTVFDRGKVPLCHVWLTRDVTERKREERAQRLLAEAGEILASSLDYGATLQSVARLAVPALADWCFVDLVAADGAFDRLAVAHADPSLDALARSLRRRYPPAAHPDAPGVSRVARTGEPLVLTEITDEVLRTVARDARHLEALRQIGPRSFLCVPLVTRGRTVGVMSFLTSTSGRRYDDADRDLAEQLAHRAAMAVENARLYREAQEANRAKSQFLATMSHELRTPLNAIAGYTELLEMGIHGTLTEEQHDDLRRIQANQRHLLGLINDLLSFARLEARRFDLSIEAVPVDGVLAGTQRLMAPLIAARGLTYSYRSGPPDVTCLANADKLQQIVLNLLTNAVKFTAAGGRIAMEWDVVEDEVHIRVRDNGRGIPPDKLEMIFEPFVQLEPGFSRRSEGTGLGLAISRDLARAMGGEVTVESTLGKGSVFTLILAKAS